MCDAIVGALLPNGSRRDDAALLAAHTERLLDPLVLSLPADVDGLPMLRGILRRWLREQGGSDRHVEDMALACSEACANAIEHAYSPPAGRVEIEATVSGDRTALITIRDFGRWRPPRGKNRGRGMELMPGLAETVDVEHREDGTSVRLSRTLGDSSS